MNRTTRFLFWLEYRLRRLDLGLQLASLDIQKKLILLAIAALNRLRNTR